MLCSVEFTQNRVTCSAFSLPVVRGSVNVVLQVSTFVFLSFRKSPRRLHSFSTASSSDSFRRYCLSSKEVLEG